jgi:hypothetical protein
MKRLYIKCVNGTYDIIHRPSHEYIRGAIKGNIKSVLKKLLSMSTEEFYQYMESKGIRIKLDTKFKCITEKPELEDWYKDAWAGQTEDLFKKLGLKNVEEDIPYKELLKKQQTGWSAPDNIDNTVEPVEPEEAGGDEIDFDLLDKFLENTETEKAEVEKPHKLKKLHKRH